MPRLSAVTLIHVYLLSVNKGFRPGPRGALSRDHYGPSMGRNSIYQLRPAASLLKVSAPLDGLALIVVGHLIKLILVYTWGEDKDCAI